MNDRKLTHGLTEKSKQYVDQAIIGWLQGRGAVLDEHGWWMVPSKYGPLMAVKPDAPDLFVQLRDALPQAIPEFNPTRTLQARLNPYSGKFNLHLSSKRHDREYLLAQWVIHLQQVVCRRPAAS